MAGQTIAMIFGFLTLVAVGIVISSALRNPDGVASLGDATLGEFNKTLATLASAGNA